MRLNICTLGLAILSLSPALAGGGTPLNAIIAAPGGAPLASFDLLWTSVRRAGDTMVFTSTTSGRAGVDRPTATGQFAGSDVYAYVWPTSLDSSVVGFGAKQGILALAVTFHPDFDDGANGAKNRMTWHVHWVVLQPDDTCGKGSLKVKDIPDGTKPNLPATWPGVPLLISSPNYTPALQGTSVTVRVPLRDIGFSQSFRYDGVTAGLKVNADLHSPLLCIADVFKVVSGDLSLPGVVR
jgi:hypothetical protein